MFPALIMDEESAMGNQEKNGDCQHQPLVQAVGLKKYFKIKGKGTLHAVDGVDFSVEAGETLGLV